MNNIQVLLGVRGIKQAYEQTLKAPVLAIKCLSKNYKKVLGDWFEKDYSPRLYGAGIQIREIVADTANNRQYYQKAKIAHHQAGFLSVEFKSETDLMIYENAVVFISYNLESPYALVITDSEIAKAMKIQFEALWEKAGK